MKAVWTIFKRGKARTFASAGVTSCQLSQQSSGEETCSLSFGPGGLGDFVRDEPITILRSGVGWFHGRVAAPGQSLGSRVESRTITLKGPGCEFAERSFVAKWRDHTSGADVDTSRGFIGTDGAGARVTVATALRLVAETVQTLAASQYAGVLPFYIGTLRAPMDAPVQKLSDSTFEDAWRKCGEFVPDLVTWWQHEMEKPVLQCATARDLTPIVMTHGAESHAGARGGVESFAANVGGNNPDGVVIIFRRQTEADGEFGQKVFHTDYVTLRHPSNVEAGWRNVLTFTVDVSQSDTEKWHLPTNLAALYWQHLQGTPWAGTLTWRGDDVLDALRPGRVLNVLGSDDASHAEMRALIYSATHDVMNGQTTVEFGRPDTLGFDDFAQLMRWQRRRLGVNDADQHHLDEQSTGESDEESYGFGADERPRRIGYARKEVEFCDATQGPMVGEILIKNLRLKGA